MSDIELVVQRRTLTGKKAKQLRRTGLVPGVLFGRSIEPVNIQCEERKLSLLLNAAGSSTLVALQIDDEKTKRHILVRDVQIDPLRQKVTHFDFYEVVMGETITTEVSIELIGTPGFEAMVLQDMDTIQIQCLPSDLIDSIQYDLSNIASFEDTVTVKDLPVPDTITLLAEEDDLVAHTEAAQKAEEEEEEVAIDELVSMEPEVIGQEELDE